MSRAPAVSSFYGEGAGPPLYCSVWRHWRRHRRAATAPRTTPTSCIQCGSLGSVADEKIMAVIPLPRVPAHCLGLAQQCLAPVYGPGLGAPVGALKFGLFSTPYLCMGSRSHTRGEA